MTVAGDAADHEMASQGAKAEVVERADPVAHYRGQDGVSDCPAPSLADADRELGSLWLLDGRSDPCDLRHAARAAGYKLNRALWAAYCAGVSPAAIQAQIPKARDIYRACSFVHRVSVWPRGYRGDFETIQMVIDLNNPYNQTDIRHHIQHHVLESPLSQQHRNKVRAQSRVILDTLLRNRTARVLSIACGACPDFDAFISVLPNEGQTIVLNDQDADAIARSRKVFAASDHTPIVVEGNVFQRIKTLAKHGPYDLVLAGGLFDYLDDRLARLLIRSIAKKLLRPSGIMFWTNIGKDNPYRPWMECVADWPLLERSEADVAALLAEVSETTRTDIQTDETGLSLLVTTKRVT